MPDYAYILLGSAVCGLAIMNVMKEPITQGWLARLTQRVRFAKLSPVATDREYQLLRRTYWILAFEVVMGMGFGSIAVWARGNAIILIIVCLVMVVNFVLIFATAVKLSRLSYSIRAALRKNGYRRCPQCKYNLELLANEGVCPECGLGYNPHMLKAEWEKTYSWLKERPEVIK